MFHHEIKKLNVKKTCAIWRYLSETTICRGKYEISEPPSVYDDQTRERKLSPDLTCTACARPADGDDLVVGQRLWKTSFLFIWPMSKLHILVFLRSTSTKTFVNTNLPFGMCIYIYIYILTARSQVLETGGGWQGPKNYFNLIFVHKNVHPFSTTSVKLHLVRGEAHGDLRNQRCVICFLWPPDQLYFHCMLAPPKKTINKSLLQNCVKNPPTQDSFCDKQYVKKHRVKTYHNIYHIFIRPLPLKTSCFFMQKYYRGSLPTWSWIGSSLQR